VTDGEIIRLSGTDPETFGRVFDRHAPVVHRYLARRVGRTLADDLTAETFLVAFRSRSRYASEHPDALPWLYGIAANLLRGHQRAEVRMYRALARTGVDPALAGPDDRVPAQVTAAAEVRELAGVLAKLPVGEREVLTLVSQAQLTYPEVARALDRVKVVPGVVDLAGRRGVAITQVSSTGLQSQLIFDSATHAYLGKRKVAVKGHGIPDGTVTGWSAQLEIAIVDRPGQEP
jgi:RNA polymerase sigma-70 factor (ECF subfamily)